MSFFLPIHSYFHSSPRESATSRIFFQPFAFEPAVPAAQTNPLPPHLFTRQTPESSRNPASPPHWVRHPLLVLPVPCSPDHPGMQSQFSPAWGSTRAGAVSQALGAPVLGTGLGREDTTPGCFGWKHRGHGLYWASLEFHSRLLCDLEPDPALP